MKSGFSKPNAFRQVLRYSIVATMFFSLAISQSEADDWLQWRGPNRTDVSAETGLLQSWPEGGPKKLWTKKANGLGYAGYSIRGESLFTMGLENGKEFALCLNAETGKKKWRVNFGSNFSSRWGDGPRTTPTIDGEFVYCMGGSGTLACLNAETGKKVWSVTMQELGGKTPFWGFSESPLIDGNRIICSPGGPKGSVAALDKSNGKLIWQTASLVSTRAFTYSSPIVVEWGGKRQYIKMLESSVVGIQAETGDVLWQQQWPGQTAVIPTPIFSNGTVYVSSGYKVGSMAIEVNAQNEASQKWRSPDMQNHHGGVILLDGKLYGYCDRNGWCCQDLETGEINWKKNKREIRKGAIAYADGRFYHIQESDGQVFLFKADSESLEEMGRFKLGPLSKRRKPMGRVWVHPVISNGRLYLRDQENIYCFDIRS